MSPGEYRRYYTPAGGEAVGVPAPAMPREEVLG
jgi:hypothetical protein